MKAIDEYAGQLFFAMENIEVVLKPTAPNWDAPPVRSAWQDAASKNSHLYDGPILEVQDIYVRENVMHFEVCESRFSHYLAGQKRLLPVGEASNSLAVAMLPITTDNCAILAQTASTSESAEKLKFFGGAAEPSDCLPEIPLKMQQILERELNEEFPYLVKNTAQSLERPIAVIKPGGTGVVVVFPYYLEVLSHEATSNFRRDSDPDQEIDCAVSVPLDRKEFLNYKDSMPLALPYVLPVLETHILKTNLPLLNKESLCANLSL